MAQSSLTTFVRKWNNEVSQKSPQNENDRDDTEPLSEDVAQTEVILSDFDNVVDDYFEEGDVNGPPSPAPSFRSDKSFEEKL